MDMVERVRDAVVASLKAQAEENDSRYVGEMTAQGRVQLDGYFSAEAVARAAIEALREPTPEMVRARWPSYHPWGDNAPPPEDRASMYDEMVEKTNALWATMIDAALTSHTDTPKET